MKRMRALVTNDDGVASDGLVALAHMAVDLDLDVVVAAPMHNASGTSAALTAAEADGRILVEEWSLSGGPDVPTFQVGATPGFIALTATRGAFGVPPAVVLSGVNLGYNTGRAILHSGTVGAAMTGWMYGCRALAVSTEAIESPRWETATEVAKIVARWVLDADEPIMANVNVPGVDIDAVRGLRQADLAPFGAVQTTIAQPGEGLVGVEVEEKREALPPDCDAALVTNGYATVTPLRPLCVDEATIVPDFAAHEPASRGLAMNAGSDASWLGGRQTLRR